MNYEGPLYGKIGRRFVPLKQSSKDVDSLQSERDQMRKAIEYAHEAFLSFNEVGNCRAFQDAKDKAIDILAPFLSIPETTSLQ